MYEYIGGLNILENEFAKMTDEELEQYYQINMRALQKEIKKRHKEDWKRLVNQISDFLEEYSEIQIEYKDKLINGVINSESFNNKKQRLVIQYKKMENGGERVWEQEI